MQTTNPMETTPKIDYGAFASDSDFKKPDSAELNAMYNDADSVDQPVFAEMRSNILLATGDHYNKKNPKVFKTIRDNKELSQQQKIRLTKNHTQKICKIYANNILAPNPGVGFSPKDESSMHDRKVSELHHSVWRDAVERYGIPDKMDDWVDSFIQIGELCVKLFWDPNLGHIVSYEPQYGEDGQPILNEVGEMIPDEKNPTFSGEFVFEEVYGFNLLRPPECKDMKKAEWLGVRKMVARKDLIKRYAKTHPEIVQKIKEDQDETYMVFDASGGGYKKTSKQTMIREYYYRPCPIYPQGYFFITTKEGILEEGELPGGLFPMVFAAFNKIQTTPRGRSPIKDMRPYQAEINRAASKMAEHQITLGDDKLLIQNGTKVSSGVSLPGVRGVNYTGAKPEILQGRDGSQYLNYMLNQITEMYDVMMVAEDSAEAQGALDPWVLLFRSAKQKKKFQRNIRRFENWLIELVTLYTKLSKVHLPDDYLIYAVGKNEAINIPEFKALPDTCYEVKIESQSEDIEERMGKQMILNHALQYVGPQMAKDDIGKILKEMPFGNFKETFSDMTLDYDSAQNDMLALDRGEKPPIHQYDNHKYMMKVLTNRTRKPDFKFITPQAQNNYQQKIDLHNKFEAANAAAIARAQQGFIPTGGYLVTCDFYVPDPMDPAKTKRAKVPYASIAWLMDQLEKQFVSTEGLDGMSTGAQAQLGNEVSRQTEMNSMAEQPQDLTQAAPQTVSA